MSRKKHQQRAKQPQRRKAVQRGGQPFTALQRASALAGLHRFVEAPRQQLWVEAAAATFWGPWPRPRQEEGVELDAVQARSDAAFFLWLLLDCQMAQGKRAVEIFLEQSRQLEPGERVCLEQLAGSDVRLWEVRRIIPGPAYELRELLNSEQLTVRSTRTMTPLDRWEVVAGRVVRRGAPGEAELEAG
ncbi:MAG: hypothetical protein FJ125_17170, partial [Deltaproteobacteria bacterium]|nr:hypothetical protein [Deltaproteobacteria bacterium]